MGAPVFCIFFFVVCIFTYNSHAFVFYGTYECFLYFSLLTPPPFSAAAAGDNNDGRAGLPNATRAGLPNAASAPDAPLKDPRLLDSRAAA
jgi:hypothetical protein